MRGQVSFEALLLTLIILSTAMFVGSLYLNTNDITVATAIARAHMVKEVNGMDRHVAVREIAITTDPTVIKVSTDPPTITEGDFDPGVFTDIENEIIKATQFESVTFSINP